MTDTEQHDGTVPVGSVPVGSVPVGSAPSGTAQAAVGSPEGLAFLAERGVGPLAETMGIRVVELSAERAVGTMPVEGNTQPVGILHGGAFVVLAESLGSMAASVHAGPGRIAVGIELNASHSRSATAGTLTGTCTALHLGRTLATHEITITDDQGRRCSTVRITNLLREL